MKRIRIFAISLVLLCLVMCAVLAGCSGDKGAAASDQTEAAQATQAAETAAEDATEAPAATEAETTADKEQSPLVGTWEYVDGYYTFTFNPDGTGTYDFFGEVMDFTYTDNGDSVDILYDDVEGTSTYEYKIEDDTLIVKDDTGSDVKYIKKD